jgi:hypothetical protein
VWQCLRRVRCRDLQLLGCTEQRLGVGEMPLAGYEGDLYRCRFDGTGMAGATQRRDQSSQQRLIRARRTRPIWHVSGTPSGSDLASRPKTPADLGVLGGRDRRRSGDLTLFRRALYQLSYPTSSRRTEMADLTGFEPATSGLTGRRALQTAPQVPNQQRRWGVRHPQRDSNPCYRLERAAS